MKRTISILLFVMVICILCLCGCGSTTLSESDLLERIPEEIKTIYIDDILRLLDVTNMEVEKRKTNDEIDEVHCTITMSDGTYETTANYILTYVFYDKGGWILDYWDLIDAHTNVIATPNKEMMETEINRYYFDQIEFDSQVFYDDTQTCDTVYTVSYLCANYSYDGKVLLQSNFVSDIYGGIWQHELVYYPENFRLDINGNWAGTPEDLNCVALTAFEIDIQSTDMLEGLVYFSATEYITNDKKDYSVNKIENSPAYITGKNKGDRYAEPTFCFDVYFEKSNFSISIEPNNITVDGSSGYGGTIKGYLFKGYHITVGENSFGWPEYHRVVD